MCVIEQVGIARDHILIALAQELRAVEKDLHDIVGIAAAFLKFNKFFAASCVFNVDNVGRAVIFDKTAVALYLRNIRFSECGRGGERVVNVLYVVIFGRSGNKRYLCTVYVEGIFLAVGKVREVYLSGVGVLSY